MTEGWLTIARQGMGDEGVVGQSESASPKASSA
jgi:hypothetical protein